MDCCPNRSQRKGISPIKTDLIVSQNEPENVGDGSSLVLCAINGRAPEIVLELYAGMAKVRVFQPGMTPRQTSHAGARRGKITTFSRKSRKRMIDKMAQKRNYVRPLFGTATYPDEVYFDQNFTDADVKSDLRAFEKRLLRRFPEANLMWRIEYKPRLSGDHVGKMAPHFHLIIDGILDDAGELRALFRQWWQEIITRNSVIDLKKRLRFDLQVAKSRRHCGYYVSKYTAKVSEDEPELLEDCNTCQGVDRGRNWGTAGAWDTSESITVKLTHAEYIAWRRAVSRWLKSKGSRFAKSILRLSTFRGCSVYGLGDSSHESYLSVFDSAAFRLLMEVTKSQT